MTETHQFDSRQGQLICVIQNMAETYGMLPTEILDKATTIDLQLHYAASLIRLRESKKARGESINDTYSQSEINAMYDQFKGRK